MVQRLRTIHHRPNAIALTPPATTIDIAVSGHRGLDWSAARWRTVADAAAGLLDEVEPALRQGEGEPGRFTRRNEVRVTSMLAQGADQLVSRLAEARGMALRAVLPAGVRAYRETMTDSPSQALFDELLARAGSVCILPDEVITNESYARANAVILARADILFTVWDGTPARGRGGTAEVVQAAFRLGLPIFVVDPNGQRSAIGHANASSSVGNVIECPRSSVVAIVSEILELNRY